MNTKLTIFFILASSFILDVRAGSATWSATPSTGTWSEFAPDNWVPNTVPNGVDDVATFGSSTITGILVVDIDVGAMIFQSDAGAYTYTMSGANTGLRVHAAGITNDSGMTQAFVINPPFGSISFSGSSTAGGNTVFTANPGRFGGEEGATIYFYENSNAGSGSFTAVSEQVINGFAGNIVFHDESNAGSATLTAQGSSVNAGALVQFEDKSIGGNATLIAESGSDSGDGGAITFDGRTGGGTMRVILFGDGTNSPKNGLLSIGPNPSAKKNLMIGSIEGGGQISMGTFLGQTASMTVGSNNLSTTFDGLILDSGGGSSLTKVGTGRLSLTNANTYTGGTTLNGGTLLVNNAVGSGLGTGPVQALSGILGGNGIISGRVTMGTGRGTGTTLGPGANSIIPGALTIAAQLSFKSDATYRVTVNSSTPAADLVIANGIRILGAQIVFNEVGSAVLPPGTVFTVISNSGRKPINGSFANLPDGGTVIIGSNTFQANYEGGDGNDLTLTVVP